MTVRAILDSKGHHITGVEPSAKLSVAIKLLAEKKIGADGASVAWQAHIGGFFAGLLLFSLFDPIPRAAPDAADGASPGASNGG